MKLKPYVVRPGVSNLSKVSVAFDKKANNVQRIIALGTFDGVHIGHKQLFDCIKSESLFIDQSRASLSNCSICAVSFYPHPKSVLSQDPDLRKELSRMISPMRSRIKQFNELGINELFFLRFTKKLASYSAEKFIGEVILPLNPIMLVVGEDWCFGKNREGDVTLLKTFGKRYHFEVRSVPLISNFDLGGKLGSSQIRDYLKVGLVDKIEKIMGRKFKIIGRVIKGDGRGRTIGYPTANVHSVRQLYPANGVYESSVYLNGMRYSAISNVGVRPTFYSNTKKIHLETHILNFNQNIYGDLIEVEFDRRVRGEIKFSSTEQLITQIGLDINSIKDD